MFKIALQENGSLRLPKHIVGQLSLQAGDTLCCHMEDRILYVTPEKEFDPTFSPPPLESDLYAVCFGSFSLYCGGKPLKFPNKKAAELLALLVSEQGRVVRKPAAAELLWPGADSVHAMDSLYKVCTALRHMRCLPLKVDRDTLWLDTSQIDSDIARFDRLYRYRNVPECCTEAIHLYTAPFLMNEYYEWSARAEAYVPLKEYSPAPTDKSFGYLGHGRIGTCLDVPSEVLRYQSSWRAPRVSVITRDNPLEFCCAYFQMIDAMRYIRSNDSEGLSFSNRMDRFALADQEGTGMDEEREVMDIFRQATDDKKLAQVWQEYAKPRGFWGGHRPYPPEDSKDPEAAKEFQARNRLFVGEAMEQTMLVLANCPSLVSYIENVLHVDFVPPPLGIRL